MDAPILIVVVNFDGLGFSRLVKNDISYAIMDIFFHDIKHF